MSKNQKGEVPRAGDMAIILGCKEEKHRPLNGTVIRVTSDPVFGPYNTSEGLLNLYYNLTDDLPYGKVATFLLTRIPPDEEAKRLFAERTTGKKVSA